MDSFWLNRPLQWPLSFTIDNDYSPIPLLIIHGDKDQVVPLSHGQSLFAAAMQSKEMWVVEGGGHIEAFRHKKYQEQMLEYLTRVLPNN